MIRSITPASVRCEECGAEAGDPSCYTRDDEPTGYHAGRRQAAKDLQAQQKQQKAAERQIRAKAKAKEDALRIEVRSLRDENRRLKDALAMIASVVKAATIHYSERDCINAAKSAADTTAATSS